jgi:dolichol kinase
MESCSWCLDVGLLEGFPDRHYRVDDDVRRRRRGGYFRPAHRFAETAVEQDKSVAGTVSVFLGGWLMSAAMIFIYVTAGVFAGAFTNYLLPITGIALVGAVVESLHYKDIDNISMTLASALVGHWFF